MHDASDEVTRAGERIEDVNALIRKAFAELLLKNLLNAANHEVDDGLRRVDDSMRVCLFGVKALEELLINSVEKVLFLGVALL